MIVLTHLFVGDVKAINLKGLQMQQSWIFTLNMESRNFIKTINSSLLKQNKIDEL